MATFTSGQVFYNQIDIVAPRGETSTFRARAMASLDGVLFAEFQFVPGGSWSAKPAHYAIANGYPQSVAGLAGQDIFDRYPVSQFESVEGKLFGIAPGTYENGVVKAEAVTPAPTPAPAVVATPKPVTATTLQPKSDGIVEKRASQFNQVVAVLAIPICIAVLLMPKFRRTLYFWIALGVLIIDLVLVSAWIFVRKNLG